MSLRTNPDRILDNIDRSRNRDDATGRGSDRQASGRELGTELPDLDATTPERMKRIFALVERAYVKCAQSSSLNPLAQRFQAVGDVAEHWGRGDITIAVRYLDHQRPEDFGMTPYEIRPEHLVEARKDTRTSRPDVNALRCLRAELRKGVKFAWEKVEPRVRTAIRDRADMGHIEVEITMDLRPAA